MKAICINNDGTELKKYFTYDSLPSQNSGFIQVKLEDGNYVAYNGDRFVVFLDGENPPIKHIIKKYESGVLLENEEIDQLVKFYSKLSMMAKELGSEFLLFKKEIVRMQERLEATKEAIIDAKRGARKSKIRR